MKAIIDENGALMVKRGPNWKIQYCQQDAGNAHPDVAEASKCGDHCPHFVEKYFPESGPIKAHIEIIIRCCHHEVNFKVEEDNRAAADSTDDTKTSDCT